MSRTTWLVITIVGLGAFIVGGGVALVNDERTSAASNAPGVTISASPPALASPSAPIDPSVSLAQDETEGDEPGKGGNGKAKGHDKKGHDKKGHEGHGKAKDHDKAKYDQDQGEEG